MEPGSIFIEKAEKISKTGASFPDEKRLKTVTDKIVLAGRQITYL